MQNFGSTVCCKFLKGKDLANSRQKNIGEKNAGYQENALTVYMYTRHIQPQPEIIYIFSIESVI